MDNEEADEMMTYRSKKITHYDTKTTIVNSYQTYILRTAHLHNQLYFIHRPFMFHDIFRWPAILWHVALNIT